jgi:hypothetical protein
MIGNDISAKLNADGRLELFALGGDRAAYHVWQTAPGGNWGGWASLAGTDLQQLAVARNADGRLELFGLSGGGSPWAPWHVWQTAPGGYWTGLWSILGYVQLPPQPPVAIDYFNAAPDYGYITIGSSATLSWQISNAAADTVVSLQGRDAGDIVLNKAGVPWKGSQTVTSSHETTYTLTAHDSRGTSSRDTVVTVYYPPNPPSGSVFYFKMTNPQSETTPCFTIAVYAKDEMTAKSIAEQQNGGYQATKIDQSQFMTACPPPFS